MGEPSDVPWEPSFLRIDHARLATEHSSTLSLELVNRRPDAVLHVRLASETPWLSLPVAEAALAPGERQSIWIRSESAGARRHLESDAEPTGSIRVAWQFLAGVGREPSHGSSLVVRLPVHHCPHCGKRLELPAGSSGPAFPGTCPWCYERMRACPVCGEPNPAVARHCVSDPTHVVRDDPEWFCVGGDMGHSGYRAIRVSGCARRWSFPVMPVPSSRSLAWSAPVCAYGLAVAAAAEPDGRGLIHGFDILTGARPWEPVELPDPVYPERGGCAVGDGVLFVATVDGMALALDMVRGTRIWETHLGGKVYSPPIAVPGGPVVWNVRTGSGGALVQLDPRDGRRVACSEFDAPSSVAPASDGGRVLVHGVDGTVSVVPVGGGPLLWTARHDEGFDGAPWMTDGLVVSGDRSGRVVARDVVDGSAVWECSLGSAVEGTPAGDDRVVVVPAGNGAHRIALASGKLVRHHALRRPVRSAPVLCETHLLLADTEGRLHGISASRGDEVLYEAGVPGARWIADPACADGTLVLAGTHGVLVGLALDGPNVDPHGV
jgi:outer membrane protein assembly factor BamB